MPTLDWIGKDKVINHHMDVPYRVLNMEYKQLSLANNLKGIYSNAPSLYAKRPYVILESMGKSLS